MARPDSRADLAGIRCPTTVVVGDSDQLTPAELAEEMASNINGAKLLIIPDSGHLSPLEQPTHVTQAIIELLRIPVGGDDN
jgi:pimeloyl-ACP methyl ester carboxylesterase